MPEYIQGDNHFAKAEEIMREVLGKEYLETPKRLSFQILEVEGGEHKFVCSLQLGEEIIKIDQQQAAGTLDAFYIGLRSVLFRKYSSLKSLSMLRFEQKSGGRQKSTLPSPDSKEMDLFGFDVSVETSLTFRNVKGGEFTFKNTALDYVQCALLLTLDALLFFVNSEKAFRKARTRYNLGTTDADYIRDAVLPILTKNNDYRKIAEQIDLENKPK